ncbi:MAG: 4Fe-4S dicluster domain-containing protein [bacterium]|nr:4Fe-4S dicluster domain-containing protein [bacterium]
MKYLKGVATLKLEQNKCTGCGRCVEVCPHKVFTIENQKAVLQDFDACMECGACQMNCPTEAVNVRAGVGCAYAIVNSKLRGKKSPSCGPEPGAENSACCG